MQYKIKVILQCKDDAEFKEVYAELTESLKQISPDSFIKPYKPVEKILNAPQETKTEEVTDGLDSNDN